MGKELLTASRVAQHLDISVQTLTNWYKWYNDTTFEKPKGTPILPRYEQLTKRGVRHWHAEDLKQLELFKEWLPKGRGGVMGEYNSRFWGKRGERAKQNKLKNNH